MKHALRIVVVAVCLAGVARADWRPDAWITTKTKLAMLTTSDVPARAINVDTVDGRVTLHGKVNSAEEKAKAEQVARGIEGVKDVRNLLQVVPRAKERVVAATDKDIQKRIDQRLKHDPALDNSSVSTESVNKGVVLLGGKADTVDAHLAAVRDAWAVPGVQRVSSEIQSPDTLADDEIRRGDRNRAAGDQPPRHGHGFSDAWITTKIKTRLLADGNTPAMDINVDTTDGIVTLFGMVPDQRAKAAAQNDAQRVSGVKRVTNDLQIVPKSARDTVKAQDDQIKDQVKAAIANRPELQQSHIDVDVKNGVVRLSGSVPSASQSLAASVTARSTAGVRSVDNQLHVSTQQSRAE